MELQEKLRALEQTVTELASKEEFIHHKWYVNHHLKIFECLAHELCDFYPQADRAMVVAMVWLHDLGKILTSKKLPRDQEVELTLSEGHALLAKCGFPRTFIDKATHNLEIFEQSLERDLSKENIDVRIASTADGCAHFIGPFFSLYWYENPQIKIDDLIESGIKKARKDFDRKIVLPEGKKFAGDRMRMILEHKFENRPEKFFSR